MDQGEKGSSSFGSFGEHTAGLAEGHRGGILTKTASETSVTAGTGATASKRYESLCAALLRRAMEGGLAEVAWLAWSDQEAVVIPRRQESSVLASLVSDFPRPPEDPLVVTEGSGPWAEWCRLRRIPSCVVAPIVESGQAVGTVGAIGLRGAELGEEDLGKLKLAAWLATEARQFDGHVSDVTRRFKEVSHILDAALPLLGSTRAKYRNLARALDKSLDSSYWRIAAKDAKGWLTIHASAGYRPPPETKSRPSWLVAQLPRAAEALRTNRPVILEFDRMELLQNPERDLLFTPTTRIGIILPFSDGARGRGVLLVGEERGRRARPLSAERVAFLEFLASRIGKALDADRSVQYEILAERRRQMLLTTLAERDHLAREVHDEVGQSLTALLMWLRTAKSSGYAGPAELEVIENAAQEALNRARSVAHGLRYQAADIDDLEEARRYAESVLGGAGCKLAWHDERLDTSLDTETARQLARVIRESVTNVARYAKATGVQICLESPNGHIRVTVKDDGVGFSPEGIAVDEAGRGLGLLGNQERLAQIGGRFLIESASGAGTLVTLEAPRHLPGRRPNGKAGTDGANRGRVEMNPPTAIQVMPA
jgi:two-component system, NarL family, sensor kinase